MRMTHFLRLACFLSLVSILDKLLARKARSARRAYSHPSPVICSLLLLFCVLSPVTCSLIFAPLSFAQTETGTVAESVTVNANDLHINTTDAGVSTVVDRQFAENLPLNGRSFQTLMQLTPGVVLTAVNNFDN